MDGLVWPARTWPLSELSEEQYSNWTRDGYLIVPDAVTHDLATAAAAAIREYIGANESEPPTWYRNTRDIYTERNDDGTMPHHGPAGMIVGLNHHASLWQLRQHPRLHRIFADLYGTPRLLVTHDRAHFKPPEHDDFPAWSDPGPVHKGLHFDVNTASRPVPFAVQGVLYLESTSVEQGPLRVVPGFHRRFGAWARSRDAAADPWRVDELGDEAVPLVGAAGSLVVWHSVLPHGPGRVLPTATRPRVSAYVTMLPVDAAPYLPPHAPPDAPLNLPDSATLRYELSNLNLAHNAPQMEEEQQQEQQELQQNSSEEAGGSAAGASGEEAGASGSAGQAEGGDGDAAAAPRPLRRLTAAERAERWRRRLPLLDEDPGEEDMPRRPPGEADGEPFAGLTPLGRRLTGLDPWPADGADPAVATPSAREEAGSCEAATGE